MSDAPELEAGEPRAVALENALRKARAVRRPGEPEIIIGCDTIVALEGRTRQPADAAEAADTIRALAGRTQQVISGLAVLVGEEERTDVAVTEVTFKPVDPALLDWYVGTGEWRERSGGYAIQGEAARLVESRRGEVENVVGLPLGPLVRLCPELAAEG